MGVFDKSLDKQSTGEKLVRGAIFGGIVIVLINIFSDKKPEATQPATPSATSAQTGAAKDKSENVSSGQGVTVKPANTSAWTYGNYVDKMSGEKQERWAELKADNILDLKFPYNGGVTVTMTVHQDKYGPSALISLSKGMFHEGIPRIKFDDGKVMSIYDAGDWMMSENPVERTFISFSNVSYGKKPKLNFFDMLKKSTHLKVEANIYDNGAQIMEFSTAGLDPTILSDIKKRK